MGWWSCAFLAFGLVFARPEAAAAEVVAVVLGQIRVWVPIDFQGVDGVGDLFFFQLRRYKLAVVYVVYIVLVYRKSYRDRIQQ